MIHSEYMTIPGPPLKPLQKLLSQPPAGNWQYIAGARLLTAGNMDSPQQLY